MSAPVERIEAEAIVAAAVLAPRPPAEGVVPILEDMLERARRGEIASVAVVFVEPDGSTGNAFEGGPRPLTMLGAIARMTHRYHAWLDWLGDKPLEEA
jgi:hypothetical protein